MIARKYRRTKHLRLKLAAFITSASVLLMINGFEQQVSAFSRDYIQNEAQAVASKAVNEAVEKVIGELDLKYGDLTELIQSDSGEIISFNSDIVNINKLKARAVTAAQDELQKIKHTEVSIPIGAFTGLTAVSNYGPDVRLTYCFTGNVSAEIINTFEDAGINQTVHRIKLLITSKIITASVDYEGSITFSTDFEIAQTVIVGVVPSYLERVYRSE